MQGYQLTEYEVLVFVPCLVEKAGHNQVRLCSWQVQHMVATQGALALANFLNHFVVSYAALHVLKFLHNLS